MNATPQVEKNSAEILAAERYLRERREPGVGDLFFLSLDDLKTFVARCAPRFSGPVLDYGCGGSPYMDLFAGVARYVRADMLPGPGVDLVLTLDGKTEEPAGAYQGVVSFQVLEHVRHPGEYLDECHRLLAAGGLLLLTTHGTYFEHKCPNDFYRWTLEGLEELVGSHGFEVLDSAKLTAGLRGALQLQHYLIEDLVHRRGTFGGFLLRAFRRIYRPTLQPLLNWLAQRSLAHEAVLPREANANVYVGVGVLARKI